MASNSRTCRWCGAQFGDYKTLEEHEKIHQDIDSWNGTTLMTSNSRTCRWCGSQFDDRIVLEEHEQFHRDIDSLDIMDIQFDVDTFLDALNDQVPPADVEPAQDFRCDVCGKTYASERSLARHKKSQHGGQMLSCSKCNRRFKRQDVKTRHEKTCEGREHVCPKCGKRCSTAHGLRRHLQWHEKAPVKRSCNTSRDDSPQKKKRKLESAENLSDPSRYRCRKCTDTFQNKHDLYIHGMKRHHQTGGALQTRPWGDGEEPWLNEDRTVDRDLKDIYDANSPHILEPHREGPVQNVYNFPIANDITVDRLMDYAREIFERQQRAFRLNLVFGTILRHKETGQYRYFVPYDRTGIFERPLYVSRRKDLDRLRIRLEKMDITTDLLRQRPDTKWIPVLVTNVHYTADSTHYPVGFGDLPKYLLNKDSIYPLVKSQHTGKTYDDDLCAFRCLALHRGHEIRCIEGPAQEYYRQWCEVSETQFDGVSFDDFPDFEDLFEINMEVYGLEEDGFALSVYKSRGLRDTTMYVNLHENHMSYVRDFSLYAQKYRCNTCDRHFDRSGNLHRHQRVCTDKTKYLYPGGFHRAQDTVFEQLEQFGINVPEDQRTFPWYICYDFEAILKKVDDRPTEFLRWTQEHVPISVSICSNAGGHEEPFCIVEPDQNELVRSMVAYMEEISSKIAELAEDKSGWVLEEIDRKIRETMVTVEEEIERDDDDDDDDDDHDDDDDDDRERELLDPLQKLGDRIALYMSQAPVIGFNSAKYDLNLIKRYLAKHLELQDDRDAFVVKQNNSYTCIATNTLKFLDMSQFLAAGSSYAGFLKAYHVEETKGYFPYEWFDDVAKLEETSLPPHDAFYSSLKGCNIGEEEYRYCQNVWRDSKMSTFRDFLIWYNDLDVGPFVTAVAKFQRFYFDKGIDVFKTAISVPGIARQLLFRTAKEENANFALFDRQNEDLYKTFKQNIVGGPSIIFTRHHKAGETRIRGEKKCRSILGFDANALYLQAIGKPMPVGPFVRRRAENCFRPELRDRFMSAYYWMDWIARSEGIQIQHKLNNGYEVRIGPYPVDGFSPANDPTEKPTCFQFQGCYWHGHVCDVTKNVNNEKWHAKREQRYRKTLETTEYLKRRGNNVVEMWECEFRNYCRQNPEIYKYIDTMRPGFFRKHRGKIAENTILKGVDNGELFGAIEVDIEVPHQWPTRFRHPTMAPYQYFEEMSPLFCTTDIPFDAFGEHMQRHVERHDLSKVPRRLLVGGTKARQILLATPLLKWYLNHGMVVTKVYQVVEFRQQRCFENFVREVSDARRQGDTDPDTAIIADTMKVIGNSGYGSLIMDKTKHREIKYVQGENQTSMKVNDPRFRKLECLDEEEQYYEVEMAKSKIKLDLPIQLGYFILQYAKLRMLEFYYDFLDQYVDRRDFEYCEMDTDSAYMAIAGSSLDDVIKPEMRDKYVRGLKGFCIDREIEADANDHWFPRTCCTKHAKYDKRTPGLFKLEYQGDEMIGLCSKTYIVRKSIATSGTRIVAHRLLRRAKGLKPKRLASRPTNEYKFSSKGVSKRRVKAPMSLFRHVLRTGKSRAGVNKGFRVRNSTMYTYTQERRGFSYFYCKRRVLDDGIHTVPLDITLCPLVEESTI